MTLTPAGRAFYAGNSGLLSAYVRAVEAARSVARGHAGLLRISYMAFAAAVAMPTLVARYRALRPAVDVDLLYARTQQQKVLLTQGDADVGFLIGPVETEGLATLPLIDDPLVAVVPPGHRFLDRGAIPPEEAAAEPLVLGDRVEWGVYRERLDGLFGRTLEPAYQSSNILALVGLADAGLGIALLPASAAAAVGRGERSRPLSGKLSLATVLAWRTDDRSALVAEFVRLAGDAARL